MFNIALNIFKIFKTKQTAKAPPSYDQIIKTDYEDLLADLYINPLKYVDIGFENFKKSFTSIRLKNIYHNYNKIIISVSEWYNPNPKLFSTWSETKNTPHIYSNYITQILNKKITNYLKENGFVTSSNIYYDHNFLAGQAAYDDTILFANPHIFYNNNIDEYVNILFSSDGDFWRYDGNFDKLHIMFEHYPYQR